MSVTKILKKLKPIVVIPARLGSTRLPNKPLADIHGFPMIVHVWKRAMEADIGPVIVACADLEIIDAVKDAGGNAIYTNPKHVSGSDRIYEALQLVDPLKKYDCVVNVQGDLPTIEADSIRASLEPLEDCNVDIATLATPIIDEFEREDSNVVKAVLSLVEGSRTARALYFSRATVPSGPGPIYHHIGIYAFKRPMLEKFINLSPSKLEKIEKLEQLRAIENGMRIGVRLVDTVPLGVDTLSDLERVREFLVPDKT
jgi:3-deoxy-manno-octulosonate cytidylyltransferase (CMP-KDO synthetase)